MARGYNPEPISSQALVNEFQKYPNIGDAIAYARQEGQHVYYVITFPEATVTWQFDKTSSKLAGVPIWTQLAAFEKGQLNRHWGNCFTPWRGLVTPGQGVLGDYLTGNLYAFNPATYLDNGAQRKWVRRWRALPQATMGAVKFDYLAIDMETGIGVPPGTSPQVMVRWSDDGGKSWQGNRLIPAGKTGETAFTVKVNRNGTTRRFSGSDRIYEISSTDAFKVSIIDAEVEVS